MTDPEKKTYIVGILHQHGDEFSATVGKIDALDSDEALHLSELWLAKKKRDHGCKNHGNRCQAAVQEAYTGLKSTVLTIGVEEILPNK